MNIGNTTFSVDIGYIIDAERPVIAYDAEVKDQLCPLYHEHPRAQLLYAVSGIIKVWTDEGIWVVPPMQAVWIASGVSHKAQVTGRTRLKNLFFDPSVRHLLPKSCFVLRVSPLLKELIDKFCATDDGRRQKRLANVIIDELAEAKQEPLCLPVSGHRYVSSVVSALMAEPFSRKTLEEWADTAGTSPRNFSRIFLKETGMTFGAWRTKVKILYSIEMIQKGKSVTETAYDLGYQSISAFIESFRKETGVSPKKYFSKGRS